VYFLYKEKTFRGRAVDADDRQRIANLYEKRAYIRKLIGELHDLERQGVTDSQFEDVSTRVERVSRFVYRKSLGTSIIEDSRLEHSLHLS
jgi:hypothetical protein